MVHLSYYKDLRALRKKSEIMAENPELNREGKLHSFDFCLECLRTLSNMMPWGCEIAQEAEH